MIVTTYGNRSKKRDIIKVIIIRIKKKKEEFEETEVEELVLSWHD
jgi:hypothetical protein